MAVRGKTVTLLVYEYGVAITKASDLEAFKTTLLQRWDSSFQATTVVWRM
ncbi:hypothetical protein L914_01272 [Phytophthora nicotianae]|uniref:Uncharacterized protein n=1 Tax=Phytophthora nicotianae TaxID=4792 RepID=W2P3D4_PHYNI|nr:hypothetical protein L914_01272 [Phytophthora nicotianae]